jgi:glycosyltransferase involved in cell wall biosynthesis
VNIALIHDWLNQLGGAEDVLEALVALYPDAPLYTALYDRQRMPAHWREWDIRPGFIDRLPFARRKQQLYFPLYPFAFEQFDLRGYDVVLSNKSGFCHGVITGPETMHVCYCLTPTRYVWRYHQYAERESLGRATRLSLAPFLTFLRQYDRLAADRVDHFIAISDEVRRRIAKVYRREATIIYPPVDVGRFTPSNRVDDYYLFVGRLVPYRRLDLLIEAFNTMGRPLVIAGSGRDRERLESLAGPTVKFLGYVPDADLPDLLARCRAFMWPGEEDFGISPLQANAAGRPIIAYAAGGALETVVAGPDAASATGALFAEQSVAAIIEAVESFDPLSVSPAAIRRHAEQYDVTVFKRRIADFVAQKYEVWNSANTGKSSAVAGRSF